MNNRLMISAPKRSSGKTTITLGITRALSRKMSVQTFKKGPDYIDPLWLSFASKRPCYNLDYFMMGKKAIISSFVKASKNSMLSLIEGNMGLYDGLETNGIGSSAHLARILKTPVILVVDTKGINRGIAPLLQGYSGFDQTIAIVGVILNKVRGQRHEDKLRKAIKCYCPDIEVVGVVPVDKKIEITERHLGLTPYTEDDRSYEILDKIENLIKNSIDLEQILYLSKTDAKLECRENPAKAKRNTKKQLRIAIAKDKAFCFYYPDNLKALENAGAVLVFFDTLKDKALPLNINALYIGGGFPELFLDELYLNQSLRKEIKKAIDKGMPTYAECGGLMYLSKKINFRGKTKDMVGALPITMTQTEEPKGFGYTILEANNNSIFKKGLTIKAHEFHYSKATVDYLDKDISFAYKVKRGFGIDKANDGIMYKNTLASYAHIHSLASPSFARSLIAFIKKANFPL